MASLLDAARIAKTIVRILERSHADRDEATGLAVLRALRQVSGEAPRQGLKTLDYAQRLAPSDGGISYAVGLLRLVLGDPRASEPLAMLASRDGTMEVFAFVALAHRAVGDTDAAVAALDEALSGHAPPPDPWFRRVLDSVVGEALRPGWCGLDNAGRLYIGGAAAGWPARDLAVLADGRPATLQPARRPAALRLGGEWRSTRLLEVRARDHALVGGCIDVARVIRVEGFVEASEAGGLRGWCWLPGEPHTPPEIRIEGGKRPLVLRAEMARTDTQGFSPFAEPRDFGVEAADLPPAGAELRVLGPHGRALYGSPLRPGEAARSARLSARLSGPSRVQPWAPAAPPPREPSIAVGAVVPRDEAAPATARPLAVVIPVYRGLVITLACIDSVLDVRALDERIIVVCDASPEPALVEALHDRAAAGRIELSLQYENRGFPATANVGLRLAAGCDTVLLNSDTVVPPHWLARLRAAAYRAPDIGTATPLSNDATIFGYPRMDAPAPMPDAAGVAHLSEIARATDAGDVVEVPTAHGFCMFIRADCLEETGLLREDVFAQGYGEENDFCLRARALGWRHVAAPGVYVGHVGGQSFAPTKTFLVARNLRILNRLHPGYDRLVAGWIAADPLAAHRRRMDAARFAGAAADRRAVLLVTHDRGGGVLRHVRERAAAHAAAGDRAILLRPRRRGGQTLAAISTADGADYPNLAFAVPDELDGLLDLLRGARVRLIELHHFVGHHPELVPALRALGCPQDVVIHDYAWFCPRITLVTGGDRYCGEPPVTVCADCIADHGQRIDETIAPAALVARSADWLARARAVVAPSSDAARRIERHFPIVAHLGVWEREPPFEAAQPRPADGVRRVCVPGAISVEKGFSVLLALARHISRAGLPIQLVVAGYTCDDPRLLDTGAVHITGPYAPGEAVALIRAQAADVAFLPSIWPETWSYALSEAWGAGLPVAAFDIGAPAERIRARGGGLLLPLHLPVGRLADMLLTWKGPANA